MSSKIVSPDNAAPSGLLDALRGLIRQGRQQALRAVDMVSVFNGFNVLIFTYGDG